MKILITGVNGFIGSLLAKTLINNNHEVIGIGKSPHPKVPLTGYVQTDILNKENIISAAKDTDVIIHLAALTAHQDIVDNKFETLNINFMGTKNVLDAFMSSSAKLFLYASTGKVYGKITSLPITESHPTSPLNILGKSKLITEKLIDFYATTSKPEKRFAIFRIFNVYGPNQKDNFLIPTILKQLKSSNKITLGDIAAKRDYTFIDDIISAFVHAIEKKNETELLETGPSVFNIASEKGTSAKEVVETIGKIKNIKIDIDIDKNRLRSDEEDVEFGSFQKAKTILGWEPKNNLEEGLKKTIEWFEKNK